MNDRVRVQLDMPPAAATALDALVTSTGAASRAEVVRKALALYDRRLQMETSGAEVRIHRADGVVILPIRGW